MVQVVSAAHTICHSILLFTHMNPVVLYSQVKYSGGSCTDANLGYFVGFGTVFYLISLVSIVQLVSEHCMVLHISYNAAAAFCRDGSVNC